MSDVVSMSDMTHYDGCWQDKRHHACALREIENLRTQRDAYANEITGALLPANERLRAEIGRLQKEVVHWREARRSCIEAGDMMKDEIERLRVLLREWLDNARRW